jgi:glycine/D-amino acid oxidase-like deaminating enzyme
MTDSVAIVGGGIGGLAAALALVRRGIDVAGGISSAASARRRPCDLTTVMPDALVQYPDALVQY